MPTWKCSFAKARVVYLDHIISGKGVEVDPEKIRAIKEWSASTNVREVKGFLGLTGYYRRFVQNYGSVAALLTQLLKSGAYKWSNEAQEAFEKLKTAMKTLPSLALPDFNLPFEIEMDASGYGIGAMLTQVNRPIAYFQPYTVHEGSGETRIRKGVDGRGVNSPKMEALLARKEIRGQDEPTFIEISVGTEGDATSALEMDCQATRL